MELGLNTAEGRALHGLLEDASGDIVIKLDANGFIIHASANIAKLGEDLTSQLLMPHICDLCETEFSDVVATYTESVLTGRPNQNAAEFPILMQEDDEGAINLASRRWYSLSLRPVFDNEPISEAGGIGGPSSTGPISTGQTGPGTDSSAPQVTGAVGLLRSVHHLRLLEGELHSRAVTDPLTGLANRHAFCASMRRQLANGSAQVVIVFAVDRMRSMLLQYGQRTADEIQWGFAKFLEAMAQPDYELAQLDNERLAIMMPNIEVAEARRWAQDVLVTFSSLAITSSPRSPKLSASAGLARLECTVDWTLRQAELALVIARAGGGKQVGQCNYNPPLQGQAAAG